jgi:aminopeptidase N
MIKLTFTRTFLLFLFIAGSNISRGNITLSDLKEQSPKDKYDILFYHLNLDISDSSTYIQGSVILNIKSSVPSLQQIVLDFHSLLTADSVHVDHQKADFSHINNELVVNLFMPVGTGSITSLQVFYHGLGKNVHVPEGIYSKFSSSWNKRITWTLSEPFSAMNWFPCKQSLTDKADSVYVFLSTDKNLKAGSNGLLTASVPLPGDRVRYEWKSRFPIAYYLISFSVSDYMDYSFYVETGTDSILVQNYIYNDSAYLRQNKSAIDRTGDLILLYSDLFGDYPYGSEKYGHCTAPFGGGMEHQTMTTLVNFSFLLVAHELSHQWFGDYVTCSSWQDIWINEGFASYAEYLANQYLLSQAEADEWISDNNDFVTSSPNGSVFMPESDTTNDSRIFNSRLSYKKGAAIIHMIRQEIGNDSIFFRVLSEFIEKHKNGNASGDDFKNHLEEVTGIDYDQFFNQWYYGEGYPTHQFSWNHIGDTLFISSLQTVSSVTPFFNVLIEFKIVSNNKDTVISLRQTNSFTVWKVFLPGNITQVQVDPRRWLLLEMGGINHILPDAKEALFKLIPNPAKEKVTIQMRENIGDHALYLIDSSGRILMTRTSKAQSVEIDVRNYTPGMYFVIIRENNSVHPEKFIIN